MQALFDRSPVLPVDAAISLARYLHTARNTQRQATSTEKSGDLQRAALLHIRVLQLVCKTLPAHPDYTLAENAQVLRDLRSVSHLSFRDVERLVTQIRSTTRRSRSPRRSRRRLSVSTSLIELFERIAAEPAAKGDAVLGLLASRIDPNLSTDRDDVAALIIPSQTFQPDWSFVRYERDIAQLLEIKDLTLIGLIALLPRARKAALPLSAAKPLAAIQTHLANSAAIILAPRDPSTRATFVTLSEKAIHYVQTTDDTPQESVPPGFDAEGEPVLMPARHVERRDDNTPAFKLYDLRPIAATREDRAKEMAESKS